MEPSTGIGANELAIILAVIGIIGTLVTGFYSYLTSCKNNERDIKIAAIKADADDQAREIKRLKDELTTARQTIKSLKDKIAENDKNSVVLRERVRVLENELHDKEKELQKYKQK